MRSQTQQIRILLRLLTYDLVADLINFVKKTCGGQRVNR